LFDEENIIRLIRIQQTFTNNYQVREINLKLLAFWFLNMTVVLTDLAYLTTCKKENAKARRIILDSVKDHIVPHIIELNTMKKMWDAIMNLYQNATMNRKFSRSREAAARGPSYS